MLFITIVIWQYVPASYFVARSRSQITKGAKNTHVHTIYSHSSFTKTESKKARRRKNMSKIRKFN